MRLRTRSAGTVAPVLVVLLVAAACASSASRPAQDTSTQYTGFDARSGRFSVGTAGSGERPPDALLMHPDTAWSRLAPAYRSIGLEPTVSDPTKRIVGVQNLVVHKPLGGERMSRLLDCGLDVMGQNADVYEVRLTVMSGIQPADSGGSTVTTRVSATAAPNGLSTSVRCVSTGRIEERIAVAMGISH